MFDGCNNIRKINISSLYILDPKKLESMFDNISKTTKILVNKNCINEFNEIFKNIRNQFISN